LSQSSRSVGPSIFRPLDPRRPEERHRLGLAALGPKRLRPHPGRRDRRLKPQVSVRSQVLEADWPRDGHTTAHGLEVIQRIGAVTEQDRDRLAQVQDTASADRHNQDLYPSEDLLPGSNYVWLDAADIRRVHSVSSQKTASFAYYETHVPGKMVLPTLRSAIRFLLDERR
jgi:hypothetical protein